MPAGPAAIVHSLMLKVCACTSSRICSARNRAASSGQDASNTAISSPPRRLITSLCRLARIRIWAKLLQASASPAGCPCLSSTRLKWSRSMSSNAVPCWLPEPCRADAAALSSTRRVEQPGQRVDRSLLLELRDQLVVAFASRTRATPSSPPGRRRREAGIDEGDRLRLQHNGHRQVGDDGRRAHRERGVAQQLGAGVEEREDE